MRNSLMRMHPDNNPNGPTFEKAFTDACVSFTHFSKAADDWCMSHEFMFMASCRHMSGANGVCGLVHSCPRWPKGVLVQANYEFNSCLHQKQSGSHGLQSDFCGCQEDGLRQRWDEDNHSSSSFCSLVFKLVGIFSHPNVRIL